MPHQFQAIIGKSNTTHNQLDDSVGKRMKSPTQCILWKNPELVLNRTMKENFELIETYAEESHLGRNLFKCRECRQLYFFEFYEEVDWVNGNDPQYITYIPVNTKEEIETLKKASQFELLEFLPRLQKDFPKDTKDPAVRWIGK